MTKEMREEIQAKIKDLEWSTNVKSILLIEWLNGLLKKYDTPKEEKVEQVIKVEVKEDVEVEKKPVKRKITFKKK